ncbi:MAG: rRNA maturation RNase YbeY [Bacteroidetes bacterium]|nr:rRNA maturation RNase YbeY [Bacteroidota bacterium]
MIQHFDPSSVARIAATLGGECTDQGQGAWRLVLTSETQGRTIVVDCQFEVESEEVLGALVTVFAPGVVIQSHRCSQVMISEALQQVVLFDRAAGVVTATILEQPAGVTHYAGVSEALLRADFTSLPEELMMSSLALSMLDDEDDVVDTVDAVATSSEAHQSESVSIEILHDSGPDAPLTDAHIEQLCVGVAEAESKHIHDIEIMLVDETRCMSLHLEHFQDGSLTDTMTFPLHDGDQDPLEGSLVLCTPKIVSQAKEYGVSADHEFARVVIHSMLHLCGWSDDKEATDPESTAIRVRENELLARLYPLKSPA